MRYSPMQILRLQMVCLLAHVLTAQSGAQLVQVPNLSTFGNQANAFPFSSAYGPMRYQQIYASSAFPHGGIIDKIMFRNDEGVGKSFEVDIDLQIAFAYATTTVGTASTIFDRNIGDDFTIVLDDIIHQSNDSSLPRTAFGFILDVANTFTYDPSRGDLLVQILVRDTYDFTWFDASWSPQQDVTTRIRTVGINESTGLAGLQEHFATYPYGLVTQFQFVPEPSSETLLLVLLSVASGTFRNIKRRL